MPGRSALGLPPQQLRNGPLAASTAPCGISTAGQKCPAAGRSPPAPRPGNATADGNPGTTYDKHGNPGTGHIREGYLATLVVLDPYSVPMEMVLSSSVVATWTLTGQADNPSGDVDTFL